MEYLLYILAGFGVFSLLVLVLRLIVWAFRCNCDKKFVPIGESEVYTTKNSMTIISANEAIEQMDKMLEQYTKPKVVVSRQCICPNCTKEINKIVINDHNIIINASDYHDIDNKSSIEEELNEDLEEEFEGTKSGDDMSPKSDSIVVDMEDILIVDDSLNNMPCNVYNNVVSELKQKFELIINNNNHRLRNNTMINPDNITESTDM